MKTKCASGCEPVYCSCAVNDIKDRALAEAQARIDGLESAARADAASVRYHLDVLVRRERVLEEVPAWQPLCSISGMLSQISNLEAGIYERAERAEAERDEALAREAQLIADNAMFVRITNQWFENPGTLILSPEDSKALLFDEHPGQAMAYEMSQLRNERDAALAEVEALRAVAEAVRGYFSSKSHDGSLDRSIYDVMQALASLDALRGKGE